MQLIKSSVELLTITPNAEKLIEYAGRNCYKSEKNITEESSSDFIKGIITRGHTSVLEHASASFRIITNRGVTHEIVRHRLASYSQESSRYCNYTKKGITFIDPAEGFEIKPEDLEIILELFDAASIAYNKLIKNGVKTDLARTVLPNGLKTEIIMSANFREWRHFIELRTSKAAHPEIRIIANKIYDILVKECPIIFSDLKTINEKTY